MTRIREHRADRALVALVALASLSACGSSEPAGPSLSELTPGSVASASNGQSLQLAGGATGGEFLLVVSDTATAGTGTSSYSVSSSSLSAPGTVSMPSTTLLAAGGAGLSDAAPPGPQLDISFGARLNERSRARFESMMPAARASLTANRSLLPTTPQTVQVGDVLTLNVNSSSCDTIVNHQARVAAVGAKSIIVADLANPAGGFTDADYQRFAADFDTLVYSVDAANFGTPADIDGNGRVILFFTLAVNQLTPANSSSYIGGFFSDRDLFPKTATARLQACPASNVAEMFYLLAPDPSGSVNGNVRTKGFVDSLTDGVVGHEFQHLINASRRIYVNNATALEVVWLNEGLSHIAEELLFYRQGGLTPRQNISVTTIRSSAVAINAFNTDQAANAARYRRYLIAPSANSPIRNDDSLATRGATWDFLRYAADRKLRNGGQDSDVWQALVNSTSVGLDNLKGVFGTDIGALFRDWSVSQYTDDLVTTASADVMQPSWNWHSIYPALGNGGGTYPLLVNPLSTTASGTVIPGGAAFYRFAVAANTIGSITISGGTTASGLPQGSVIRIR